MAKEIERKFLVIGNSWKEKAKGVFYCQGYLNSTKERVVRVRTIGEKAFLTIKGVTIGASRLEYEYEIPVKEANEMLKELCEKPVIEKHRYTLEYEGHNWEIDEFHGENEGLIIAEVELESEDEELKLPGWVDKEVTSDPKYYNANLITQPFKNW